MTLRKPTLGDRLSYHVDNLLAWHPITKVIGLFAASLVLVLIGALLYAGFAAPDGAGFSAAVVKSWAQLVDPSLHTYEETRPAFVVGLLTSVGGMIVFALLVGLVSDGLGERMDELKKGTSRVVEKGHTLVLGWSDKLVPLIRQLCVANQSTGGGVVVVLAERDKEEMEAELRDSIRDFRGSSVVCRTGSPWMLGDLEKVGADAARAIIVLASDPDPDESDGQAIRTVLALRRGLSLAGHAVVEVCDEENFGLIAMTGGDKVEPIVMHDVTGRLMVQSARQPGLAHVYDTLLDFDGAEFYLKAWPELEGKTFWELSRSFPDAVVCGIRPPGKDGRAARVLLNPPDETALVKGAELLVLANDDDGYRPAAPAPIPQTHALPDWRPPEAQAERILICGWRRDLADMVTKLDDYVAPGSELTILAQAPIDEREAVFSEPAAFTNLNIVHRVGNPALRRELVALEVERFDSVLLLSEQSLEEEPSKADTRNLSSLLFIRDIQEPRGRDTTVLISEIRDPRTKLLVATTRISDYVVSSEIMSKYLAQVAERQEIARVWSELLDPEGNEIYLKDARYYAHEGETLSFWELSARARKRGDLAIGYRPKDGVHVLNPRPKSEKRAFGAGDQIIVIAESDR